MGMDEKNYKGQLVYHGVYCSFANYNALPQAFQGKMTDYFITHNAQGLATIGLDGWKMAPSYQDYIAWQAKYPGRTKPDSSGSTFYEKVLAPLNMTYEEWCRHEVPPLP